MFSGLDQTVSRLTAEMKELRTQLAALVKAMQEQSQALGSHGKQLERNAQALERL